MSFWNHFVKLLLSLLQPPFIKKESINCPVLIILFIIWGGGPSKITIFKNSNFLVSNGGREFIKEIDHKFHNLVHQVSNWKKKTPFVEGILLLAWKSSIDSILGKNLPTSFSWWQVQVVRVTFFFAGPGFDERSLGRNECSRGFNRHFGRKWQWLFRLSLGFRLHRHDVGKLSVHLKKRKIQLFIQIRLVVKLFSPNFFFYSTSNDPSTIQTCFDA